MARAEAAASLKSAATSATSAGATACGRSPPICPFSKVCAAVSEAVRDEFVRQGMNGGLKGLLDSIRAFSESDFNEDLKKFDKPTLVLHGDDDQIVPIGAAALSTIQIVKHAVLKVYEGADHGLTVTHQDRFNADLLDFINS